MQDKKIEVAFIAKNLEKTGISAMILNFVKNINRKKINITLLVGEEIDNAHKKTCDALDVKIIQLPNKDTQKSAYFKKLKSELKSNHYDIAHIHGNSAMMLFEIIVCKQAKIQNIVTHCHSTSCNHNIAHHILRPFMNLLKIHRLACSGMAGRWAYGRKKFTIINNGIQADLFKFNPTIKNKSENFANKDSFIIGQIGVFNDVKNQKFTIDIVNKLITNGNNIDLFLIGDGPMRIKMTDYAKQLECYNSIHFTGAVSDIIKYYNLFDILVMPSLYEGLPVTLIEAQANGVPCILSDVITKEVKINDNLDFVSIRNEDQWVKSIEKQIKHRDNNLLLREQYADAYIEAVKNSGFDIIKNTKNLENFYTEVMQSQHK